MVFAYLSFHYVSLACEVWAQPFSIGPAGPVSRP